MTDQLKIFNGLMTYLKSIGSVGANIDMDKVNSEYFDGVMWRENGNPIKLIKMFNEFILNLCDENGSEMWDSTSKGDTIWYTDVTINPQEKEIILQTNYYEITSYKQNVNWDWWDIPLRTVDYISDVFEKNKNVEKLIFDCGSRHGDFELHEISLKYMNGKKTEATVMDWNDNYTLKGEIFKLLKFKILGERNYDDISNGEGFDTTIVCGREEETSYVDLEVYSKEVKKGKRIVIDKNYFN